MICSAGHRDATCSPWGGEHEAPTRPTGVALILPAQWHAAYQYFENDSDRRLFLDLADAYQDGRPHRRRPVLQAAIRALKR